MGRKSMYTCTVFTYLYLFCLAVRRREAKVKVSRGIEKEFCSIEASKSRRGELIAIHNKDKKKCLPLILAVIFLGPLSI
jgi:hypothetical protein